MLKAKFENVVSIMYAIVYSAQEKMINRIYFDDMCDQWMLALQKAHSHAY